MGLALNVSAFSSRAFFGGISTIETKDAVGIWKEKSRSVAMMVSGAFIDDFYIDEYELDELMFTPLKGDDGVGLCEDEPFAHQPANPMSCTGFLVAPNIIATAGHCVTNDGVVHDDVTTQCSDFSWLFDYEVQEDGSVPFQGQSHNRLYHCKKIITAFSEYKVKEPINGFPYGHDMALVVLDRSVEDREILKISKEVPKVGSFVNIIGHPLGLPKKLGINGRVNADAHPYFYEAGIDAFSGSSGSPVFDSRGDVVGILVRGPEDLYFDEKADCERLNRCDADGSNCIGVDFSVDDADRGMHIQKSFYLLDFLK